MSVCQSVHTGWAPPFCPDLGRGPPSSPNSGVPLYLEMRVPPHPEMGCPPYPVMGPPPIWDWTGSDLHRLCHRWFASGSFPQEDLFACILTSILCELTPSGTFHFAFRLFSYAYFIIISKALKTHFLGKPLECTFFPLRITHIHWRFHFYDRIRLV